MENSFDLIPHAVINPSSIVTYNEINWTSPRKRSTVGYIDVEKPVEDQSKFLNSSRKANGLVSDQAVRKISKALEYLIVTAREKTVKEKVYGKIVRFRTAFVTLTLPSKQIHSDKEIINGCLNQFLIELRKYHGVRNYVWRAELQKNGNIHFHLIIDCFVPWNDMRNRWNRIVNKLGYVDRFQEIHGKKTPNSTDIHSTRKVINLKLYLIKYMAKDNKEQQNNETSQECNRIQEGRIWGCNQELSQTRGLNLIIDSEISEELKKVIDNHKIKKYEAVYFTVYYLDYHKLKLYGSDLLFKYFSDYLFEKLNYSEQLKITV